MKIFLKALLTIIVVFAIVFFATLGIIELYYEEYDIWQVFYGTVTVFGIYLLFIIVILLLVRWWDI